uniref:Uncharacterized protein n=1 Tax=Glossina austeni TaxID=7395 RepID=A0A1A9VY45_GLOAU
MSFIYQFCWKEKNKSKAVKGQQKLGKDDSDVVMDSTGCPRLFQEEMSEVVSLNSGSPRYVRIERALPSHCALTLPRRCQQEDEHYCSYSRGPDAENICSYVSRNDIYNASIHYNLDSMLIGLNLLKLPNAMAVGLTQTVPLNSTTHYSLDCNVLHTTKASAMLLLLVKSCGVIMLELLSFVNASK